MKLSQNINIPPQKQSLPGSQKRMRPLPIDEDKERIGSGKLTNKVVLITGADSGIGRSAALLFAKEGADVCVVYLNEHKDANETIERIEQLGQRAVKIAGDLSKPAFC